MTWLRQALHVAAKDARMAWYFFAALVPLVVAHAFQVAGAFDLLWSLLVMLLALSLVAYAVHADAAVRSDAFWVTLPLNPGAVFAGKVLSAAAVLALVLAGEAIVLARHAATAAETVSQLGAMGRGVGQLLCIAILIATLTRDLRTFLLVLVFGALAWFIVATAVTVSVMGRQPVGPPPWLWPLLLVLGSLALAGYQYRSGRRLRVAVAAGVFLGAVLILGAAYQPNPLTTPRPTARLPQSLRPDSVVAARLKVEPDGQPDANVSVHLAGGSRQLEYTLTAATLEVRLRDGSTRNLPLFPPPRVSGGNVVPDVPGARWANVYTGTLEYYWAGVTRFGQDNRPQGTPLRVEGELEAAQPYVAARLPLRAGASLARAGQRLRIVGFAVSDETVGIDVEISRIDEEDQPFALPQRIEYALLDRAHGLVYPLERGSSSSGSNSLFGGARLVQTQLRLYRGLMSPRQMTSPTGPGPFELLLIDWRVLGAYHVDLPVDVRLRESPPAPRPAAAPPLGPRDPRNMTATLPTPSR